MPQFVRVELWNKLRCQSGTKLAVLYPGDLVTASDIRAIDDTESLTFAFTRYDKTGVVRPIVSQLVARSIATVVWDDGSFDEWRVSLIDDSRGANSPITVTANPLLQDLAEGADSSTGKGLVSTTTLCLRTFSFSITSLAATDVWSTYVIPACPPWVSSGTIDPSTLIPQLSWDRLTPQALALLVRDTLRKMNVSCELRLRRNGTTDYKLDLVTQTGSGATVPLFLPRTSLGSLKRRVNATQQATRLFITGEADPSGLPGIPGRARWRVTNVNGGTLKLTLADPNGGTGPIGMTNQWTNAYVLRVSTGRTFQIQASDSAAQTVTLLSVSTIVAGELVELRITDPGTNTRQPQTTRYAISSVASNNLTLSSNPIVVDGQYIDWYARVWTLSSGGSVVGTPQRISASTASTDVITVASAAGFNNTQFVEFIQLDGAGEIASYLDHAGAIQAPPAGYGMKAGDLSISNILGVTQLQPNAWMRTWSNSGNPPDGWLYTGTGTPSQNSNTSFIRYGPFSYLITGMQNGDLLRGAITSLSWAPGNTRVSARCNVYVASVGGAATSLTFRVKPVNADGTLGAQIGNAAVLASPMPTGAWSTLEVVGIDVTTDQGSYGLAAEILCTGVGAPNCYFDTFEFYPFVANPATVFEYGDATTLHQAGNRYLVTNNTPPITYDVSIADLERQNPTDFARSALTLGGNVRAVDGDLGVDVTVRLLRMERDLLRPKQTTVSLSNLPAQLLRLIGTG